MNPPAYEIPVTGADPVLYPPTNSPIPASAPPSFVPTGAPLTGMPAPAPGATSFSSEDLPPPVINTMQPPTPFEQPAPAPTGSADPDLVAALKEVLRCAASDLHLTANAQPMIRIDGQLRPIEGSPVWDAARVTGAIMSILSPPQREIFGERLELDLAYTVTANARFRVNVYQQRGAVGAAFRLIPTGIKALEALGLPDVVATFATLPRGLVLVTGPTGSGKSTTLAGIIDLVNRTRSDHIVTIEDPIEFLHANQKALVNQREVGADTHSFANALKHVLRQDPDVILIGELRDLETISVALTAAETGHLVFATLHTQDAAQTIDRVIDVFPPHQQSQIRLQLASVLQGIVCQSLVKRATGAGRVVASEVLVMTPAIGNLIREGKTFQIVSAMQSGRGMGMVTLDQNLAELVNDGSITQQAAVDQAHDIEGMKRMITRVDATGYTDASKGSFTPESADGARKGAI